MGKFKPKAIQTVLGTFRQNQTNPEIIHAYPEPCVTLTYLRLCYIQNLAIFRTRNIFRPLSHSEFKYIQNTGIFRTLASSKSEAYPEFCQTSTMKCFAKIVNDCNYFHKL